MWLCESIRHVLNNYLKYLPYNKTFNMLKYTEFKDSNTNLLGLVDIEHHAVIDKCHRYKQCISLYLSTNLPKWLSRKLQFDVPLYFCRRGQENMHTMTKTTFSINTGCKTLFLKYVNNVNIMTNNELIKRQRIWHRNPFRSYARMTRCVINLKKGYKMLLIL